MGLSNSSRIKMITIKSLPKKCTFTTSNILPNMLTKTSKGYL